MELRCVDVGNHMHCRMFLCIASKQPKIIALEMQAADFAEFAISLAQVGAASNGFSEPCIVRRVRRLYAFIQCY